MNDHIRAPRARLTARLTSAIYFALLASLVITTFYPAPVEDVSIALILGVKLLPLVFFAVHVVRGHNRAYIWLSFVVLFYFTSFVVRAWLTEGAFAPILLTTLTFLLFTLAMVHLKVNRHTITASDAQ